MPYAGKQAEFLNVTFRFLRIRRGNGGDAFFESITILLFLAPAFGLVM
jgi:hypothetical protein